MPHVVPAHSGATSEELAAPCQNNWPETPLGPNSNASLVPRPPQGLCKDSRTASRFWRWADRLHEAPEQYGPRE